MADEDTWAAASAAAADLAATVERDGLAGLLPGLDPSKVLQDAARALRVQFGGQPVNRAAARAAKRAGRQPGAPRQAKRRRPS